MLELRSENETLLSRVVAAEELLRAQQQQKAAADEAAAALKRRPSTEKKQEPPAFSRAKKGDSVLRQPADREPIAQQSQLRRPQNPNPRSLRVPAARAEFVPAPPKSAPAASTKSRRESLIPRFSRPPSSQGQQQTQSQAPQQHLSRRKSVENNAASANTRPSGERSWLSATLKSVTRQSSLPSTRTATPATTAASSAAGIPSTTMTNRRHTIAPSTKRRPPPARDSRTAVRESPM